MMHQIRKMVGLAMMMVRTGCPISRIQEAFGLRKIAIAKAPSLGLLLEYPLFSHYNEKTAKENGRDPLDFEKYKKEIDEFKQKFIYSRIFEEEEKQNTYIYLSSCLGRLANKVPLLADSHNSWSIWMRVVAHFIFTSRRLGSRLLKVLHLRRQGENWRKHQAMNPRMKLWEKRKGRCHALGLDETYAPA